MGGDIEPLGRNDYKEPLVDEKIEDSLEQKKDEVPPWYLEDWKKKKIEEVWRDVWHCKSIKN